jgi:hypothetical protein
MHEHIPPASRPARDSSSLPAPSRDETVSWSVVDLHTWQAHSRGVPIGTIVQTEQLGAEYSLGRVAGELTGQHSSLENAKAQLEGWARWQLRLPWAS